MGMRKLATNLLAFDAPFTEGFLVPTIPRKFLLQQVLIACHPQ